MSRCWTHKFADAFRGLWRAVRTQSSFAVHISLAITALVMAAALSVSPIEWCLIVLAIGFVLAAEVFNTAIESLAQVHDVGHHPRIRDALDVASGAVLAAAITSGVIGLTIFMPKLFWLVFGN